MKSGLSKGRLEVETKLNVSSRCHPELVEGAVENRLNSQYVR